MRNLKEKIIFKSKELAHKIIKPNIVTIVELETSSGIKRKFFGKSLTGNFLAWLYLNFHDNDSDFALNDTTWDGTGTGRGSIRLTGGGYTNITANRVYEINGAAGDLLKGINIGTGTTPATPLDYDIETSIAEGVGVGQMNYGVQGSIQGCTVSGSTTSFIINRLMTNNSGSPIDVSEITIQGYSVGATFTIYRDVFSAVTVQDGESMNCKITFAVTT